MHICNFFYLIVVHSNMFQAFVIYNLVYQLQCSNIKFCSYSFVLNKAPNNKDITHIANIILNKAPNSNDTTCIVNNVGAQQFSMVATQPSCRKANLPERRDSDMITRKVCAEGNKLSPEKEWRLYVQQFIIRQQVNQYGQAGSE